MSEILEQLQVNSTFFVEFGLFFVFFFVLKTLYLKPFQKLIEKRNQRLNADVQGLAELLKKVEQQLEQYESEINKTKQEAKANYEKVLAEMRAKEDAVIHEQKEELKKDYQKILQFLLDEKKKIELDLESQVEMMAELVAEKTLTGN